MAEKKKRGKRETKSASASGGRIDRKLAENFIALQRVMVNLSLKFDNLANQISQLLNLFELSAKALAKREVGLDEKDRGNKMIIEKLNNLTEQNKIIARGLTLMHENEQNPGASPSFPQALPPRNPSGETYEKSISSSEQSRFNQLPRR